MERFYNLKIGKKNVNGSVLRVDLDKPLESRVEELTDEASATITLVEMNQKRAVYEIREPSSEMGEFKMMVESGKPAYIQISVTPKGVMELTRTPKNKKVYLSEITAAQAKKMKEDAGYWRALQLWV